MECKILQFPTAEERDRIKWAAKKMRVHERKACFVETTNRGKMNEAMRKFLEGEIK